MYDIPLDSIIAAVFDTTASHTGIQQGCCTRLGMAARSQISKTSSAMSEAMEALLLETEGLRGPSVLCTEMPPPLHYIPL